MAKVFRLHNIQGDNSIVDWQESKGYGSKAISQITDPDGATAKKEITSIPSPFARIDLVKTAFKEVNDMAREAQNNINNRKKALSGTTIYHKMVSEMFDVAQLFFNIDRFKDKFEILVWDRTNQLDPNSIFGSTLKLYLEADAAGDDPYNFSKMTRVYMLNYTGKDRPSNMNIVGGTSPATLFFSSANDLSYVSENVLFDNDRPFDDTYQPLYKRSFDFLKYIFALSKTKGFANDFPEINDYLWKLTYGCLTNDEKGIIDALTENSVNDYDTIGVGVRGQDFLEILGRPFHKKQKTINWKSDFTILSNIYQGDKAPLVLPVERGNLYTELTYTTGPWEKEFKAPYFDEKPWKNRFLPEVNDEYPYLTISDFLTDTIVRIPYCMNGKYFFDGRLLCKNEDDECSYLLPLKSSFFQFFTTDELRGTIKGTNKPMFEFVENAGGIKVILRIPIQKGYIEYSRIYFEEMSPNLKDNNGGMIETKIGMGIMPLVRFPQNVGKHYRIAMFDKGKNDASLSFYEKLNDVQARRVVRAQKDLASRGCSHEAYSVEDNFDRILIRVGEVEGYIVPIFKQTEDNANEVFTFAVDFGTTNTHIEYCTRSNPNPRAFDIKVEENKVEEKQMYKLHKSYTDPDIRTAFEEDFIPDIIGDERNGFPMRTVFASHSGMNLNNNPIPLADGNIPFLYEKEYVKSWNNISTELKWGGVPDGLLEMYIDTLFIMMRNKVVLNKGNLSATKLIWFYPASMTIGKINLFSQIWDNAYQKYFGPNVAQNVISISESKAPYLHFIKKKSAAPETVTIDIGGGTTDVFVVERKQDRILLSFRFASNAIFGDSYNSNPSENGFVCKYMESLRKVLESNKLLELQQAMNQIEEQGKSTDIINFMFSLVGEKVNNNRELNLLSKLSKDGRMRYVFIIFYGSILYFIAKVMKAKGLQKPKTIAFSGNGARTKCILSNKDSMVAEFAKLIFDGVYGDNEGAIDVKMEDDNPKIATCKGGIEDPTPQAYNTIGDIKTVYAGNDFNSDEGSDLTYANITSQTESEVVKAVEDFFCFLFELHQKNNQFLVNSLAADPAIFNDVYEFCTGKASHQLLEVSMTNGISKKREEDSVNDQTPLEETLFFYPLVGLLHDLAYKISQLK